MFILGSLEIARSGLPISVSCTFSLGVTAEATSENILKIGDFASTRSI